MSNSNKSDVLVTLYWIVTVILSIVAGFLAWDWIEPDGFFGFIGFFLIWGILCTVAHFLAMGLVSLLGK